MRALYGWYFDTNLLLRILIGLVLGAILGIVLQHNQAWINFLQPFGDVFVRLLKMIVLPVVAVSIIAGAASISPKRLGKVGVKVLVFYMVTSFFAIVMGLIFGNLIGPGEGMNIVASAEFAAKEAHSPSLVNIFMGMIPTNPFDSFADGKVLPVIFFCLFFGIGLAFLRDSEDKEKSHAGEVVFNFFNGSAEIIFKIIKWILEYAPIGVFALIFVVFAKQGGEAFGPLLEVTGTVYLALIAQLLIVYSVTCLVFGINPIKFFQKIYSPLVTAFVSRSSGGTLGVSMDVAENKMGIPKGIYGFTLPLGSTINMDGSTIYLGVCAIFIANAVGLDLTFSAQLTIVLTAVLAAIGTAGVPGAGAIMLIMVLESVGLKIEAGSAVAAAYAMIFGIDALLDMGRTAVNVSGDLLGTAVVAKTEGEINAEKWK